ncbi:MAG TPA: hypothetical protein VNS59_04035 [Lysobacter sp.]|nr:hypothetical protein [Lysobacter sp.]
MRETVPDLRAIAREASSRRRAALDRCIGSLHWIAASDRCIGSLHWIAASGSLRLDRCVRIAASDRCV